MLKKKTRKDLLHTFSVDRPYGTMSPQFKRLIKLDLVAWAGTWNLSTSAHTHRGSADQQVIRVAGRARVMCMHEQSCVVSWHKIVFWSHFVSWLVGVMPVSFSFLSFLFQSLCCATLVRQEMSGVWWKIIQFHLIGINEYNLSLLNDCALKGNWARFEPSIPPRLEASEQTQFHIYRVQTN